MVIHKLFTLHRFDPKAEGLNVAGDGVGIKEILAGVQKEKNSEEFFYLDLGVRTGGHGFILARGW